MNFPTYHYVTKIVTNYIRTELLGGLHTKIIRQIKELNERENQFKHCPLGFLPKTTSKCRDSNKILSELLRRQSKSFHNKASKKLKQLNIIILLERTFFFNLHII